MTTQTEILDPAAELAAARAAYELAFNSTRAVFDAARARLARAYAAMEA